MRARRHPLMVLSAVACLYLSAFAACELPVTPELEEVLRGFREWTYPAETPYKIVGADGNRLFFMEDPDAAPFYGDEPVPEQVALRVLDLETLEEEVVQPGAPADPHRLVTNGTLVAWAGESDGETVIHDLATEQRRTYAMECPPGGWLAPLEFVSGGRLLVWNGWRVTPDAPYSPVRYAYVIVTLESGEQMRITEAECDGGHAVAGDFMVFTNDAPTQVEPISLEWTHNLEVVDLRTGDRRTIASDVRSGPTADLAAAGDRILWREYEQGSFQSKIVSYDPETGEKHAIAENLGDPSDDPSVFMWDANEDWMLLQTTTGRLLIGETWRLDLRSFDGTSIFVAEYTADLSRPWEFDGEDMARLVGDYVVWTDPFTAELVIFDPGSGTTRRFDPAE